MKLAVFLAVLALPGLAQGACTDDAMIVLDGSSSMARSGYKLGAAAKIDQARAALGHVLPQVPSSRPMGLLTYGAGGGVCDAGAVRVPPKPRTADAILAQISGLVPEGDTPLARAITNAANVLDHRTRPVTIAVITDGLDTCGGAVCTAARILANEGADTVIHVVYFRRPGEVLSDDEHLWRTPPGCLAHYTGGRFLRVTDEEELTSALSETLTCPHFSSARPNQKTSTGSS